MHFSENFKQAYLSLTTNKLRSILTMLGIIMGVFSVVAIMAISNATKVFMVAEFNKLGANTVFAAYAGEGDDPSEFFTLDDLDNVKKGMPEVQNITAVQNFSSNIRLDEGTRDASITATTSQYTSFSVIDLVEGRFIDSSDVDGNRRVCVVPDTFAMEYYGTTDILGEEISMYNWWDDVIKLKVVGVMSTEANMFSGMLEGLELPVEVYAPITTMQEFYYSDYFYQIQISVEEGVDLKLAGEKLVRLLEFTHDVKGVYYAASVEDIQRQVGSVLNVISSILLVIAIITLVVGGIGIINILLVSVTERIREIGLRKAIGAKKRDIVMQFLTESIMMTGFSGLIGIILGVITGGIISNVIKIPPVVDFQIIIITFMGSLMLGLIFGVYPAKRAADLDPIESLRYE